MTGYDYTVGAGRKISAETLQKAFWYLEGEDGGAVNSFVNMVTGIYGNDVMSDYTGSRVVVLNLTLDGKRCQDQIAMVNVPAPGAVLLSGLGCTLVGWLRRRRSI